MSMYNRILSLSLDLLHAVHALGVSFERKERRGSLGGVAGHDPDAVAGIDTSALIERERWLREKLRRYPFWAAGHVALATVCLRRDDIGSAYASAVAALKIADNGSVANRARIALGRSYLRRGDSKRAIETFEIVVRGGAFDRTVTEDLAAAYLAEEDFVRTVELLESIPEGERSGEGLAALTYARRRRDGAV